MKKSTISNEALAVLSAGRLAPPVIGNETWLFYLPDGQLDSKLYTEVNKVLETFGGKWDRRLKAHVFGADSDPLGQLDDAIATGTFTRLDKNGYFPTPGPLADTLIAMLEGGEFDRVLEPSAGDGALLRAFGRAGYNARVLQIVEPNEELLTKALSSAEDLVDQFDDYAGYAMTFEGFAEAWSDVDDKEFNAVIMNPPFENGQDAKHITLAIQLLKPGGQLVAIAGAGLKFRQDKAYRVCRELLEAAGTVIIDNPEGAFKSSGTGVRTVRLHYRKPVDKTQGDSVKST